MKHIITQKNFFVKTTSTCPLVCEEVKTMTQEQFENEKNYSVSIHFVEQMQKKHIITKEELEVCKQYLENKYKPLIF